MAIKKVVADHFVRKDDRPQSQSNVIENVLGFAFQAVIVEEHALNPVAFEVVV